MRSHLYGWATTFLELLPLSCGTVLFEEILKHGSTGLDLSFLTFLDYMVSPEWLIFFPTLEHSPT